ncbi:MAG: glucose-6-phosphate isomerase [Candidatus Wallbacteria bacterium]|nr:glucose-6-phosphate isomerase [Candidatus Wallbacteria bacterium]
MDSLALWNRYRECLCECPGLGVSVDYSRIWFPDGFFESMEPAIQRAFRQMAELEAGAVANPDEKRMVGHYWLRAPERAPDDAIRKAIETALRELKRFARNVHSGRIRPPRARKFENFLVIGIGGSSLGPQFVSRALWSPRDRMRAFFFDNTDPDGMDAVLAQIGQSGGLARTLVVVISKSGGTKETRNGMLEAELAFKRAGLSFARHAVAVTGDASELDRHARAAGWLQIFPMWDWVGGRTSELAAVGLLPAALQGLDVDGMLLGARYMDEATRVPVTRKNPAAVLALMWHHAGAGRGAKDMVVLPYKDRLELFSRYLQQLVMESLGKEHDLEGKVVEQGLAVYGNKGSTDQHAYVQQLRDGVNNFFVTFLEVLRDRHGRSSQVEPGVTSGDYLSGFLQGTRRALADKGRESLTVTVDHVDAMTIGRLIALYERAVGLYASLVGINAYHQPGVEAGKKAAAAVIGLQHKILQRLRTERAKSFTSEELAVAIGEPAEVETVHWVLRHLAANPDHRVKTRPGKTPFLTTYSAS